MRQITRSSLLLILAGLALPAAAAECRRYGLSVVVDGTPLYEHSWRGRTYVEATKGRTFTLRVTNPTSERVAVAISVDGRNVVDAKRTSAPGAAKWILSPWQTVDIPGWQISGETARQFYFTDTAGSYAKWLGDTANVGTIEAVFFRELHPVVVRPVAPPAFPDRLMKQAPAPGAASGAGAPGAPPAAESKAESKGKASALRSAEAEGFAATGIGERTSFPVQWVDFNAEKAPAARVFLRYEFHRELVRLGVLSGGDDLFARDRARGFEPDYAPDPYRHRSE